MDISISLARELLGLIQAKIVSGRYASTTEVVHEVLRLLEHADATDSRRRQAWDEAMASADAGPRDFAISEDSPLAFRYHSVPRSPRRRANYSRSARRP